MKRAAFAKSFCILLVVILTGIVLVGCANPITSTPTPGQPSPTAVPTIEMPVTKISWRANAIIGPTSVANRDEYYGELMRNIYKETGGRLEIQTHWNNELGFGNRDYPKLLKQGLIEISDLPVKMGSMYISAVGYETLPLYAGPPFPREKTVDVHKNRRPIYDEMLAPWNGKRLATFWNVPSVDAPAELSATKPFRTLDEMKGTVKRSVGPEEVALWNTFGVKSVIIPSSDVYLGFKTGLFESAPRARVDYIGYKIYEVAKYIIVYYPARADVSAYGWAASTLHWGKLSPDIQNVVEKAYKQYESQMDLNSSPDFVTPDAAAVEKIIKDYGITVITWSAEDQAKIQAVVDREIAKWLATTDDLGRRLYKSDMDALGRPERYEQLLTLGKQLTAK